jgi:hypothetical protein
MSTSEEYMRKAAKARLHASSAKDPRQREALLRTAAQWERLADHKPKWKPVKPTKLQTEARQGILFQAGSIIYYG